jgi:hypothetical protein
MLPGSNGLRLHGGIRLLLPVKHEESHRCTYAQR